MHHWRKFGRNLSNNFQDVMSPMLQDARTHWCMDGQTRQKQPHYVYGAPRPKFWVGQISPSTSSPLPSPVPFNFWPSLAKFGQLLMGAQIPSLSPRFPFQFSHSPCLPLPEVWRTDVSSPRGPPKRRCILALKPDICGTNFTNFPEH